MYKTPLVVRSLLALTVLALLAAALQRPAAARALASSAGAITTLYANDPLECSLCLRTGEPGIVTHDGQLFNKDSHICLGFFPDCLTVGIQGGETGAIVDLGTLQEAGKQLGMPYVGNSGNVYVGLELPWVKAHKGLERTEGVAHAPAKAGHVYLARIVTKGEPDILVKLLVLEFRPTESVTFRWQRLEG